MAWNLSPYFNKAYVPDYLQTAGSDLLANALQIVAAGKADKLLPRGPGGYNNLANRLYQDAYAPWQKKSGVKGVGVQTWAQQYWDWLRGGAKTAEQHASTLKTEDYGNTSASALHYVQGVGYVQEADLADVEPAQYAAIQAERAKAVADKGAPNAYYESNPVTTGQGAYKDQHENRAWVPNVYGAKNLNQYKPGGKTVGATAGGANRNGNYATTSTVGQTAKTVATAPSSMSQQARETAAKRTGRTLSSAGVTRVPNVREQYSRMVRQQYKKY